mmetsp:Transcript_41017/g.65967  ORF Transcript_41017/g.65967 Transcript_41017/m.65967 type:complete len:104 (-) Transcript_41017:9-320(-)
MDRWIDEDDVYTILCYLFLGTHDGNTFNNATSSPRVFLLLIGDDHQHRPKVRDTDHITRIQLGVRSSSSSSSKKKPISVTIDTAYACCVAASSYGVVRTLEGS